MEKEKYLNIVNKLIEQGYPKEQIELYIKAMQKTYTSDSVIYENLIEFIMEDEELNNKVLYNLNMESLIHAIKVAEGTHVTPSGI